MHHEQVAKGVTVMLHVEQKEPGQGSDDGTTLRNGPGSQDLPQFN